MNAGTPSRNGATILSLSSGLLFLKTLPMRLKSTLWPLVASLAVATALVLPFGLHPAAAQGIVTAANGDPITTYDVDQHLKLLQMSHKSATRSEAIEDVVADRLKFDEAKKWGVDAADSDIAAALDRVAAQAKMQPNAWLQAAQRAHIDTDTIRAHLRALAAWNAYVRARNKTLGVSEEEISAQLAKQGSSSRIMSYSLRQIVFVLPAKANAAAIEARIRDAQALRNRFTDCGTGVQLARALPDVAVKEALTRTSDALSVPLRTLLSDTPEGHLTPPERSPAGIELVAVCQKSDSDPTTLRDRVQNELITSKLETVAETMYKQIRAAAVISKY